MEVSMSLWPEMNDVLNQLELLSNVSAPNPNPSGGDKPGSVIPTMSGKSPRDYWLQKWRQADTNDKRAHAIEGARDELAHLTRRMTPVEIEEETAYMRERRILSKKGWTPKEIEAHMEGGKVSAAEVRAARFRRGLDPVNGYSLEPGTDPVKRLLEAGASVRQVETLTKEKGERVPMRTAARRRAA